MNKERLIPELRFPEFKNEGDWKFKTIDELCDILNNIRKPISSGDRKKGSYPYYGASGIIDYVDDFLFNERLLLIGEDGAKWGAYENTAFLVEGKYWVNNHAHVLKPNLIDDKLLESYLVKLDLHPYITGAAPPKLTLGKLKEIVVPVPENPQEQQRIASCLSSLDEVITAHSQKLDLLKNHKKGLMQNLFPQEGETVPKYRFKEFEKDGEWVEKKLGQIAEIKRGAASNNLKYTAENSKTAIRLLRINDFLSNQPVFVEDTDDMKRFRIKSGDILIAGTGATAGITFMIPEKFNDLAYSYNAPRIRVHSSVNFYVYHYLKSDLILHQQKKMFVGNAQPFLDTRAIGNFVILLPKNSIEQQKIASCLSSLDALITAQAEKIEQLKLHKKGLMQGLFPKIID